MTIITIVGKLDIKLKGLYWASVKYDFQPKSEGRAEIGAVDFEIYEPVEALELAPQRTGPGLNLDDIVWNLEQVNGKPDLQLTREGAEQLNKYINKNYRILKAISRGERQIKLPHGHDRRTRQNMGRGHKMHHAGHRYA